MLLALCTVGFRGGIRGAFENTSHDVYFSNKKTVVNALITEIGHHEDRAYNVQKSFPWKIYVTFELCSVTDMTSSNHDFRNLEHFI